MSDLINNIHLFNRNGSLPIKSISMGSVWTSFVVLLVLSTITFASHAVGIANRVYSNLALVGLMREFSAMQTINEAYPWIMSNANFDSDRIHKNLRWFMLAPLPAQLNIKAWRHAALLYSASGQFAAAAQANQLITKIVTEEEARHDLTTAEILDIGNANFDSYRYADAVAWYLRIPPDKREHTSQFKIALAAIYTQNPQAATLVNTYSSQYPDFQIFSVKDFVVIAGKDLRTVNRGLPVSLTNISAGGGILTSNYEAALIVNLPKGGRYQVEIDMLHSSPPPVEAYVGANGRIIGAPILAKGDLSWGTVSYDAEFWAGLNTVNVRFRNDLNKEGKDRNLIVRQIVLRRLSP